MDRATLLTLRRASPIASSSRLTLLSKPIPINRPFFRSLQTTSRQLSNPKQPYNPNDTAYAKRMQSLFNQPTQNKFSNPTIALQQPWPWHELPFSASASSENVVLQRTLFARPPDLSPPLLLFAAGIWGLFVFAWLVLPEPHKKEKEYTEEEKRIIQENEKKAKEANVLAKLGMGFTSTIFSSAQPLIYGLVSVALITLLASSTRIVTRISMVQIKPKNGNGAGKTVLRLTNVGHEMIPWRSTKFRELTVGDCQVYIPNLNNSHTIRLKVLKDGKINKSSMDRFPYSLDYRALPDNTRVDKEVVQSVNRLQHVFGPLKTAQ